MGDVRTNRKAVDLETAILTALERPLSARELWAVLGVPFDGTKSSRAALLSLLERGEIGRFGVRRTFETGTEFLFSVRSRTVPGCSNPVLQPFYAESLRVSPSAEFADS